MSFIVLPADAFHDLIIQAFQDGLATDQPIEGWSSHFQNIETRGFRATWQHNRGRAVPAVSGDPLPILGRLAERACEADGKCHPDQETTLCLPCSARLALVPASPSMVRPAE